MGFYMTKKLQIPATYNRELKLSVRSICFASSKHKCFEWHYISL